MSCGPIGAAARFRIRWSLPLRNKFLVDSVFNDLEEAEFVANILGFLLREVSLFNALGFSMREVSLLLDFGDCGVDSMLFSRARLSAICEIDIQSCIYVIITTIIIRCTDDEISDAEISRNGSSSPKALVAEARHLFCLIDII